MKTRNGEQETIAEKRRQAKWAKGPAFLWDLPWGLGVHGDQRALKKKRQRDLATARHGLTKAINPSPHGPRDPRTWEEEFWRGRESGLQRVVARPGEATRAGVNCAAAAHEECPCARRRRGIELEKKGAAQIGDGEEETERRRKKKVILRRR
jgi:hypothetical protein